MSRVGLFAYRHDHFGLQSVLAGPAKEPCEPGSIHGTGVEDCRARPFRHRSLNEPGFVQTQRHVDRIRRILNVNANVRLQKCKFSFDRAVKVDVSDLPARRRLTGSKVPDNGTDVVRRGAQRY